MPSTCEQLEQRNNELEEQNRILTQQSDETSQNPNSASQAATPGWISTLFGQIQGLVGTIAEQQSCNEECKRTKRLKELRDRMIYAQQHENENSINAAEIAYYSYRDGDLHNRMRFYKKYREIGNNQKEKYNDIKRLLNTNITNSKQNLLSFFISIDNINNVINITKNQNKKIKTEIDEMTSDVNKNDRKFYYKQQYLKFKSYIKYFLSGIFIVSCLIHLYLSDIINKFITNKAYYTIIISIMISYLFIVNNLFYYILK